MCLTNSDYTVSGANVYDSDLVIETGEKKVIEGKELKLNGDLILEPNSKFILKNSTLYVLQEYKSQYSIKIHGGALFKTVGSKIETYKASTNQYDTSVFWTDLNLSSFDEHGNIIIKNSNISARVHPHQPSEVIIENSNVAYLYWVPRSDAKISDSKLGSLVFGFKHYTKPEKLTFEGLYPNERVSYQTDTADGGSLNLDNTLVKKGWHFNMEFTPKEITIKDSHLSLIWIKFPPTEKEIEISLVSGKVDHFSLQKHVKGVDLPYNVTLINTEIESFKPEMFGTKAVFEDVYAMIHSYDGSTLCIRNSTIYTTFIYGANEVQFINTTIEKNLRFIHKPEFSGGGYSLPDWEETIGVGGRGKVIFHNSKIDVEEISVACEQYNLEGGVEISQPTSMDNVFWTKGTISRNYPVEVRGQNGEPCSGIPVSLYNEEGNKVFEKHTNEDGNTDFKINFDKQNYDINRKLKITVQDSVKSKNLTFLSSTPILFNISQFCGGTSAVFRVDTEGNVYTDKSYFGKEFKTGGADIAESIKVSEPVEPGDVIALDPNNPRYYHKSQEPYSTLASGVIVTYPGFILGIDRSQRDNETISCPPLFSSQLIIEDISLKALSDSITHANTGLKNKLTLETITQKWTSHSQWSLSNLSLSGFNELHFQEYIEQTSAEKPLIALMGVVPVKATAENGPIKLGDLLATASKPGHVMACKDRKKCMGAIVGKALESLEEGSGVIRMLVMR